MEYDTKVELLKQIGLLDKHSPTPKVLPRISSEDISDKLLENNPFDFSGHFPRSTSASSFFNH